MGGGLMQLVAYGAQDIYLTGNPQITFFKVVYRRHTNFSMELIEQTFNGSVSGGSRVTSTISRNGDLVHRLYTNYDPAACAASDSTDISVNYLSYQMLKTVELEIGGQKIDKLYNHWLIAQHELFTPNQSCSFPVLADGGSYATAVPIEPGATDGGEIALRPTKEQAMAFLCKCGKLKDVKERSAWVPLPFWFCRNVGLALPLIALQYHEVKVIIELAQDADCTGGTASKFTLSSSGLKLWAEYIYLDTDERRRFAQVSHEYLIEQLQFQEQVGSTAIDLNFNHPVKEIIFAGERAGGTTVNGPGCGHERLHVTGKSVDARDYPGGDENGLLVGLKLNGHERFTPQHLDYFTRTQVCQHHSGNGGVVKTDSLGVYSFALKPEEHQPSGTCNFSRIDSAQLTFSKACNGHGSTTTTGSVRVYAVNYNVLRIMSGMGGLAYSN
tara:strand:- start:3534 stop:4856 length:1323 start_codon:yes stop_codon:yes gene_type:complete